MFYIKKVYRNIIFFLVLFVLPLFFINLAADVTIGEPPTFDELIDVIGNIISIAVLGAGVAFVGFAAFGAFKGAMSLGDPQGLEGAKQTWTNALIGFAIVVGVFVILRIILRLLGFDDWGFEGLLNMLKAAMTKILGALCIGEDDDVSFYCAPLIF